MISRIHTREHSSSKEFLVLRDRTGDSKESIHFTEMFHKMRLRKKHSEKLILEVHNILDNILKEVIVTSFCSRQTHAIPVFYEA